MLAIKYKELQAYTCTPMPRLGLLYCHSAGLPQGTGDSLRAVVAQPPSPQASTHMHSPQIHFEYTFLIIGSWL
jgi:hypothetical protein